MCGGKKPKTPGDTEGQKAIAEIATEKWNHYQKNLLPFENEFIDKAHVKAFEGERAAGMGNIDAQASIAPAMAVTGGAQRSGNLGARIAGSGLGAAKTVSSAKVRANSMTEDRKVKGLQAILAAGNGQRVGSQQGILSSAASNFRSSMSDARINAQDQLNKSSTIMQGIGAGTAIYGNMSGGGETEADALSRQAAQELNGGIR